LLNHSAKTGYCHIAAILGEVGIYPHALEALNAPEVAQTRRLDKHGEWLAQGQNLHEVLSVSVFEVSVFQHQAGFREINNNPLSCYDQHLNSTSPAP
jgi:hypothetical protein